jgi:hypothetical protein
MDFYQPWLSYSTHPIHAPQENAPEAWHSAHPMLANSSDPTNSSSGNNSNNTGNLENNFHSDMLPSYDSEMRTAGAISVAETFRKGGDSARWTDDEVCCLRFETEYLDKLKKYLDTLAVYRQVKTAQFFYTFFSVVMNPVYLPGTLVEFVQAYIDNPLLVAQTRAKKVGKALAKRIFNANKPVSLCGFSLGCTVIWQCLTDLEIFCRLEEEEAYHHSTINAGMANIARGVKGLREGHPPADPGGNFRNSDEYVQDPGNNAASNRNNPDFTAIDASLGLNQEDAGGLGNLQNASHPPMTQTQVFSFLYSSGNLTSLSSEMIIDPKLQTHIIYIKS